MTKEERENDCFCKLIKKDIPAMSTEQAIEVLHELDGSLYETQQVALDMAINALETVKEFERAQIITGGRLNGRTYAYKCGLEDGKRKALEQQPSEDAISLQAVINMTGLSNWFESSDDYNEFVFEMCKLPPVTPTHGTCKDCKHWKDSDGVYRRGVGTESKCPINNSRVFEGTFWCADYEKRGDSDGSN